MAVPSPPPTAARDKALIVASCALGAIAGGFFDGALRGTDTWFGAFGAVFGLSITGLLASGFVEYLLPLLRALLPAAGAPAAQAAPALPVGALPGLSGAGRLIQAAAVAAAGLVGVVLFVFGMRVLAPWLRLDPFVAAVLHGGVALVLVLAAPAIGALIARRLDLVAEPG